jgi:hypothetical protein
MQGEGMKYRLLTNQDTIQVGDEILNDDCETWDTEYYASKEADGKWFIGKQYNTNFYVPTRRKIID